MNWILFAVFVFGCIVYRETISELISHIRFNIKYFVWHKMSKEVKIDIIEHSSCMTPKEKEMAIALVKSNTLEKFLEEENEHLKKTGTKV